MVRAVAAVVVCSQRQRPQLRLVTKPHKGGVPHARARQQVVGGVARLALHPGAKRRRVWEDAQARERRQGGILGGRMPAKPAQRTAAAAASAGAWHAAGGRCRQAGAKRGV